MSVICRQGSLQTHQWAVLPGTGGQRPKLGGMYSPLSTWKPLPIPPYTASLPLTGHWSPWGTSKVTLPYLKSLWDGARWRLLTSEGGGTGRRCSWKAGQGTSDAVPGAPGRGGQAGLVS